MCHFNSSMCPSPPYQLNYVVQLHRVIKIKNLQGCFLIRILFSLAIVITTNMCNLNLEGCDSVANHSWLYGFFLVYRLVSFSLKQAIIDLLKVHTYEWALLRALFIPTCQSKRNEGLPLEKSIKIKKMHCKYIFESSQSN